MGEAKCGNCRFFKANHKEDKPGECMRWPPVIPALTSQIVDSDEYAGVWPDVLPHYWCGEHQPMKSAETRMVDNPFARMEPAHQRLAADPYIEDFHRRCTAVIGKLIEFDVVTEQQKVGLCMALNAVKAVKHFE